MPDAAAPETQTPHTAILVVGDWFIDETWTLSPLNLHHSSQPGEHHYEVRHDRPLVRQTSPCGASIVYRALRNVPGHTCFGVGAWNPADEEVFPCALCPAERSYSRLSHLNLRGLAPAPGRGRGLCSQQDATTDDCEWTFGDTLANLASSDTVPTNRIIRCESDSDTDPGRVLYRIDWESDLSQSGKFGYGSLTEKTKGKTIAAVVIVDHGKGVMRKETIRAILELDGAPKARWFIRSKMEDPAWMKALPQDLDLELVVIDFKLADHLKPGREWWHGPNLGRAGLELLGELTRTFWYREDSPEGPAANPTTAGPQACLPAPKHAVVLCDDNKLFALELVGDGNPSAHMRRRRAQGRAKHRCHLVDLDRAKQRANTGRTSVLFASLVAQRLQSGPDAFGLQCQRALAVAYEWTEASSGSGRRPHGMILSNVSLPGNHPLPAPPPPKNYDDLWRAWIASSSGIGTVRNNKLQLWRAEGSLKKYICVGSPKRTAINRLVWSVGTFKRDPDPARPLSCLVTGAPGWGKTFLAKCLADRFGMEFVEFSMAQMASSEEVIDCLTAIAAILSRTERRTLVFVDEINAPIQGFDAIPLFLGPLWDGHFMKDGHSHRLKRCAWVFASTSSLKDMVGGDKPTTKGSDFVSRLNGPILDLTELSGGPSRDAIAEELGKADFGEDLAAYRLIGRPGILERLEKADAPLRTEQVYSMLSLLDRPDRPIRTIQRAVLQLFHDMVPVNGFRSMEILAARFEEVRGDCILVSNVPRFEESAELRRHVLVPLEWLDPEERRKKGEKRRFVVIERTPHP